MIGALKEFPSSLLSWIQHHAKFSRSWNEPLLRGFLEERGVPCSEIVVAWERALHSLGEGGSVESPYLLELSDTCFGTVATGAAQATLPGDSGTVVIVGRFVGGGALGLHYRWVSDQRDGLAERARRRARSALGRRSAR